MNPRPDRRAILRAALQGAAVRLAGPGALAALAAGRAGAAATQPTTAESPPWRAAPRSAHVGINLTGLAYWTSAFPFADLMKNSTGWSARDRQGGAAGTIALAANGYPSRLEPGQSAVAPVAWQGSDYAPGNYVVRWDGDGELAFPGLDARIVARGPRRIVLDVQDTKGAMHVAIVRTNPADPVRNLRFLWPGTEGTHAAQPFNPLFLERLAPFSTLRFIDWGATNGSPVVRWADRAWVEDRHWTSDRGVPLEVMLDLANTLQADPWLCIPHLADDDCVRNFAALVKTRLDPRLKATIEYSNEVWNVGFAQTRWALAESARLGFPAPSGQPSAFYAERVTRIAAICAEVFGPSQRHRWAAVIAAQAAWTNFAKEALAWKDTASKVDALAIAPYFQAAGAADPKQVERTLALDSDAIIDQMLASIRGEVKSRLNENAVLARRYRLALVGYEGGAHDSSGYFPADKQEPMAALFAAAHRQPRMRAVYREYFEAWIAAGGGVLNQYADIARGSKWGFWGVLDAVTQDPASAPKYLGLLDVIAAHPVALRPPPR